MSAGTTATLNNSFVPSCDSQPAARTATFLMCQPSFYEVSYVINPWMAGNIHASSRTKAKEQWELLRKAVSRVGETTQVEPKSGLPDMVFTANAGLERDGTVVLSSFFHRERQGEEPYFLRWFQRAGYNIVRLPREVAFEGEGDALFATDGSRLWAGYGQRTSQASHRYLSQAWNVTVTSMQLIDPRFYHLDTCFAPLEDGSVMYHPPAFDEASLKKIEDYYAEEKRIVVKENDALCFACNAVNVGNTIILNEISRELSDQLKTRGFYVVQTPLSEFLKAGGAAKCLVMKLSGKPQEHRSSSA